MISYQDVTKIFGSGVEAVTALRDVTFDIEQGELVVFLGPSTFRTVYVLDCHSESLIGAVSSELVSDCSRLAFLAFNFFWSFLIIASLAFSDLAILASNSAILVSQLAAFLALMLVPPLFW